MNTIKLEYSYNQRVNVSSTGSTLIHVNLIVEACELEILCNAGLFMVDCDAQGNLLSPGSRSNIFDNLVWLKDNITPVEVKKFTEEFIAKNKEQHKWLKDLII